MKKILRWLSFKFSKIAFIAACGCYSWRTRKQKISYELCFYHRKDVTIWEQLRWESYLIKWV